MKTLHHKAILLYCGLLTVFTVFTSMKVYGQVSNISGIVNIYTPVTAIDFCSASITVASTTGFKTGDTAILIQMKGAIIDSSNSNSFGKTLKYNNAGNYEMGIVKKISGTDIFFTKPFSRNYSPLNGRVQLVRLSNYQNASVTATLTPAAWNGSTGGVLAIAVKGKLSLKANIDATNTGFRPGLRSCSYTNWGDTDYYTSNSTCKAGGKGEGIAELSNSQYEAGYGPMANGGGGGNSDNGGGGGGANMGSGGFGGAQVALDYSGGSTLGGRGGISIASSAASNNIFLGGGGGGGHQDQKGATDGSAGGGIIIIIADTIEANNDSINSKANDAIQSTNDGAGGGGGGGSILLDVNTISGNLNISAKGGNGGDENYNYSQCHAPGGGGGGGLVWFSMSAIPSNVNIDITHGSCGTITSSGSPCYKTSYYATNGTDGDTFFSLVIPTGSSIVNKLSAGRDTSICQGDSVNLNATGGPGTFSWKPSKGLSNSTISNPIAKPLVTTRYFVTLTQGKCILTDSVLIKVGNNAFVKAGNDTSICLGDSFQLRAIGTKGKYFWTPSLGLSNDTIPNPIAKPSVTTKYIVKVQRNSCIGQDTIIISVNTKQPLNAGNDTSICKGYGVKLKGSGANGLRWYDSKNKLLSQNDTLTVFPPKSTLYYLQAGSGSCLSSDSVKINVINEKLIKLTDTSICSGNSITITPKTSDVDTSLFTLNWDNGLGSGYSKTLSPDSTTRFKITLEGTCTDTAGFLVRVKKSPRVNLGPDISLCDGDSYTFIAGTYKDDTYLWQDGSTLPTFLATKTGTYWVKVSNSCGSVSDTIRISNVFSKPIVNLGRDTSYCEEDGEVRLSLNRTYKSYLWQDSSKNSNYFIHQPGIYSVKVIDSNGCAGFGKIKFYPCPPAVFVPNVFTPNGDSINDVFEVFGYNLTSYNIRIFNRWGERIFVSNNINNSWDGTFYGVISPDDIFIYLIYYEGVDFTGTAVQKWLNGTITLLR